MQRIQTVYISAMTSQDLAPYKCETDLTWDANHMHWVRQPKCSTHGLTPHTEDCYKNSIAIWVNARVGLVIYRIITIIMILSL